MSRSRKVWLVVMAGMFAFVTALFLWASWKNDQNISEVKSITDRLQTEPGWENLDTQPPVGGAFFIPLDGPCSQYAYRWDTHRKYREGDCRGVGAIDGWNVRITISDYGQDDSTNIVQIVVNKYGY